jgi:phosphoribosylaminoimidazole (AIR) synthetase
MKDEQVKQLNGTIIKLLSDFEREHNVTIDDVTIVVNDSVCKGIVCRSFSIETSYNEEE